MIFHRRSSSLTGINTYLNEVNCTGLKRYLLIIILAISLLNYNHIKIQIFPMILVKISNF